MDKKQDKEFAYFIAPYSETVFSFPSVLLEKNLELREEVLRGLINEDPFYLNSYLVLSRLLQLKSKELQSPEIVSEIREVLNQAYNKVMDMLTGVNDRFYEGSDTSKMPNAIRGEKGDRFFPKYVSWRFIENRALLRAQEYWAKEQWRFSEENNDPIKRRSAYEILLRVLKMNPLDDQNIRYDLLALKLGYKLGFEEEMFPHPNKPGWLDFNKEGDWFMTYSRNFPSIFGWLREWYEEREIDLIGVPHRYVIPEDIAGEYVIVNCGEDMMKLFSEKSWEPLYDNYRFNIRKGVSLNYFLSLLLAEKTLLNKLLDNSHVLLFLNNEKVPAQKKLDTILSRGDNIRLELSQTFKDWVKKKLKNS